MMARSCIPLNLLRAFEAAVGYLSLARTAIELNVTHSTVSQYAKALRQQLNCQLFVRGSHGLMLTAEGESLLSILNNSFDRMAGMLDRFATEQTQEKLKTDVVGIPAVGCLFPLLDGSKCSHPHIDSHISTHNNRVDPAVEGLDYIIRYGGRAWCDIDAQYLCSVLMPLLYSPTLASQTQTPVDILKLPLLRSYRRDEWALWMQAAREAPPPLTRNVVVFDSPIIMLEVAQVEIGVAITPVRMLTYLLSRKRIVQPLLMQIDLGSYWITCLQSCPETPMMREFSRWLTGMPYK